MFQKDLEALEKTLKQCLVIIQVVCIISPFDLQEVSFIIFVHYDLKFTLNIFQLLYSNYIQFLFFSNDLKSMHFWGIQFDTLK